MSSQEKSVFSPFESTIDTVTGPILERDCSQSLEAIYTMETVDPKTIKPLKKSDSSPISVKTQFCSTIEQLKLNLGPRFSGELPKIYLQEPLEALRLSPFAQRAIRGLVNNQIGCLIEWLARDSLAIKSIGQGHIQEIQEKLKDYLDRSGLTSSTSLNLPSLARIVLYELEPKDRFLCLSYYGLEDLVTLSSADLLELSRLDIKSRQEKRQHILNLCRAKHQSFIEDTLGKIAEAILTPFFLIELNVCSKSSITYYLANASALPSSQFDAYARFFMDLVKCPDFFLNSYLYSCEKGVYAYDSYTQKEYSAVIGKARSYFYNDKACYSLTKLCQYIYQDFARYWVGFPDGFVEKCLFLSKEFTIFLNQYGQRAIAPRPQIYRS